MTDPRILGSLERIARALEEQVRLQRRALQLLKGHKEESPGAEQQAAD